MSNKVIKARDRVIVTDVFGKEWKGTVVNVNEYRPPESMYCVTLDDYDDDYVFVPKEYIKLLPKSKRTRYGARLKE